MNIIFVHCRIANGGALNVLKDIIDQQTYKTATIFTLYSDREYLEVQGQKIKIITALPKQINTIFKYFSTHKIKGISSILDYRNLMLFYPLFMKTLSRKIRKHQKKYATNKIIISSFAIAKNIKIHKPNHSSRKILSFLQRQESTSCNVNTHIHENHKNIPTILYLHSPMQYIRSHHEEYLNKLTGYKKRLFKKITPRLRKRDKKFTQFDKIIANSEYTAQLAKEMYNITCDTIAYPKVHQTYLNTILPEYRQSYYVYTGRLVNFVKECDKIIKLFNENGLPLLMIGSGPDEWYLKSIAKENIIFLGRIQDQDEIIKILSKAKGMINITKESFGLGTAESLLCGTPVLGFADCASKELIDKQSGILVEKKDKHSLENAFEEFIATQRESKIIQENITQKLEKYPFKI